MVEKKIRHLPVVDASGAVVGVITDRDLRSAALAPALEQYLSEAARRRLRGVSAGLENLRLKDAMTCNPVTARPDMAVSQAAAVMLEMRVGSLPVIEDGKLVGIVTGRDAVKALARAIPALQRVPESSGNGRGESAFGIAGQRPCPRCKGRSSARPASSVAHRTSMAG